MFMVYISGTLNLWLLKLEFNDSGSGARKKEERGWAWMIKCFEGINTSMSTDTYFQCEALLGFTDENSFL